MGHKRITRSQRRSHLVTPEEQKAVNEQHRVMSSGVAQLFTGAFRALFPHSMAVLEDSRKTGRKIPPKLLRQLGAVYYAASPSGCTITDMEQDPLFSDVSRNVLLEWSKTDGWRAKRAEFWKEADEVVRRRIAKELTLGRLRDLEKLKLVQAHAFSLLLNEKVAPSTWEGVANAVKRISESIDVLREKLAKDDQLMPPSLPTPDASEEDATPEMKISLDEAREAARYILEMRAQRELLSLADEAGVIVGDDDGEEEEG